MEFVKDLETGAPSMLLLSFQELILGASLIFAAGGLIGWLLGMRTARPPIKA